MPRKSRELRLSQTLALITAYEEANLAEDYRARFARDMANRLTRGRGTSTKQRNWIDTLIEEGVPAPKGDPALLARIEAAQAVEGMSHRDIQILGEFAGKIARGWDLSEKQTTWMNGILENADHIAKHGPWTPTADQVVRLEACVKLAKGYSQMHWSNNPGTYKALMAAMAYIEDGRPIEEWHVNKLLKAMKGKLRELFEVPYVTPEKPCYVIEGLNPKTRMNEWGLGAVMGAPSVSERGTIVYPVLLSSGTLAEVSRQRLAKRKPR